MTLHPVSHNILMDISDACAKPGTIWASCASFEKAMVCPACRCVLMLGILHLVGLF